VAMAEMKEQGNKYALLVGIDHYDDEDFRDLEFAAADSVELGEVLREEAYGGFDQVTVLCDAQEEADGAPTRAEILSRLTRFARHATEQDMLLVFVACHGCMGEDGAYLFCQDARSNVLPDTAISLSALMKILRESAAKARVLLVDACHADARTGRAEEPMSADFVGELTEKAEGFVVISACNAGQVSYEDPDLGHGVFSHYLLAGLRGEADTDRDGWVTAAELFSFVSRGVRQWALAKNKDQSPTAQLQLDGDVILSRSRFVSSEVTAMPYFQGPSPSEVLREIQIRGGWPMLSGVQTALTGMFVARACNSIAGRLTSTYPPSKVAIEVDENEAFGKVGFPGGMVEVSVIDEERLGLTVRLDPSETWIQRAIDACHAVDQVIAYTRWEYCTIQMAGTFDVDQLQARLLERNGIPSTYDMSDGYEYTARLPIGDPDAQEELRIRFRSKEGSSWLSITVFESEPYLPYLVEEGVVSDIIDHFLPALAR